MKIYDVAIIGAGTAGLTARKQVANVTDNYVVIDPGELGTTCARVGCMPSKVLIQVANDFYRRNALAEMGISGGEDLKLDQELAMRHVRKLRDRFVRGVLSGMESWAPTHLIKKRATFIDQNTLDLGDEQIKAKKIIIATGSHPIIPQPWLPFQRYFLDTNAFFEEKRFPESMAVIGLGVIGLELGQALHRLGVNVIGVGKGKAMGGLTDPKMIDYVAGKFSEEMNIDFTGVESLSEENNQLIVKTEEKSYAVDKALVSIGRRPNVDKLGLENTGVELQQNGIPLFDSNTFQLNNAPIYIAGDVNGERPILHESADEGAIAGFNAVSEVNHEFKRRVSLGITFSAPNIATVGDTYSSLKNRNIEFEVGEVSFEGQGRSIVMLKEKGLLRVYGEKKTGRLLGAEIFGPSGEHLAHLLAWVIAQSMTVGEVLQLPFYHPVVEEGLRTALRDLSSQVYDSRSSMELSRCNDHPSNKCP